MVNLVLSILSICCLIVVNANVVPNHLNSEFYEQLNVGINHNLISSNLLSQPMIDKNLGNPVENCVKKCKEDGKQVGLCKLSCENRHLRRTHQDKYTECMKNCQSSAMGEAQSPNVCECRQSCEKSFPKNVFIY